MWNELFKLINGCEASVEELVLCGLSCERRALVSAGSNQLLGEQENFFLFGARCELDMQELMVESADGALQESGLQFHSQRMEHHQANQLSDHFQREKSWPCAELDRKVLQEDLKERYSLGSMNSLFKRKEVSLQWISLRVKFRNYKTR